MIYWCSLGFGGNGLENQIRQRRRSPIHRCLFCYGLLCSLNTFGTHQLVCSSICQRHFYGMLPLRLACSFIISWIMAPKTSQQNKWRKHFLKYTMEVKKNLALFARPTVAIILLLSGFIVEIKWSTWILFVRNVYLFAFYGKITTIVNLCGLAIRDDFKLLFLPH